MTHTGPFKQPFSVLVIVHTPQLEVLLLERVGKPGMWQSVTGSLEVGETPVTAACREVEEETGLHLPADAFRDWQQTNRFRIRGLWQKKYAPDVRYNTEHVFSLCIPEPFAVRLAPDEHHRYEWLSYQAAAEKVFSWSNRDAILRLPRLYACPR